MEKIVKLENILSQIRKLDYEARLYLLESLIKQMKIEKEQDKSDPHHLIELHELGSEIWKDVDIDKYVEQERKWD